MSIYGLVSDYRANTSHPEWYTAERYDYCEQIPVKELKQKKTRKFNPFHFLAMHIF